ncbi:MAG: hypothetical protein Q9188_006059 [Gyalolechia gomerana]
MADKLEEFGQKRKAAADKDHGDLSSAGCPPHHPSATALSLSSEWVASKAHVPKQVVLFADETLIRSVQQPDTENHASDTGTATTREIYKPIKIMRCTASISYMRPTANTAETPAFLLMGICNLQMEYIDRNGIRVKTVSGSGGFPDLLTRTAGEDEPEEDKGVHNKVAPYKEVDRSIDQTLFGRHKDAHVLQ